jgi:pilus assembly protein FimV
VLKTLLKAAGLLVFLAWCNLAGAATMGGINVISSLGSPLKAEISLAELGRSDKSTLVAKLASVGEFKSAGLDYPYSLPKLTFDVQTRDNGDVYIRLTSTQPVNEPFVSLLVELSWPSGKLLREYTFLLDPASFVPEQPKATEVKPVEPMVPIPEPAPAVVSVPVVTPAAPEGAAIPAETAAAPVVETNKEVAAEPAPTPAPVMSDMAKAELAAAEQAKAEPVLAEPGKVEPAEAVKTEPLAATPQAATTGSVIVEKGDTLGKIADEVKPVDVSLERMLVAMYRANAKKFDGKNMNRIRAGKILRMPEASEIEKVSQSAAVKEIRAQVADWQDYRQKLAAAQSSAADQAPKQEAAGKISTAVAEKAPVAKESAKEVLRLSKGESLGDKTVAGSGASKQEKITAKADDATAKSKQVQEEQKKLAKLENINKDVSKLVELKAQPVPEAAPSADQKPTPAPVPPKKMLATASAVPATAAASEDFDILAMLNKYLSMVMDDPVILGVVVAVILGLGALGFVMMRRGKGVQKKTTKKNSDVGEGTGSWRTPVAPSPDTGDFTRASSSPVASASPMSVAAALDDVDPISEADLFLNFGRDVQAEEILKDALSKNPSNIQIKLKLLSIYSTRKDVKTFTRYAQEIKDSGDTGAWERAAVMGRDLDPSNPNYGDAKGEVRNRERPPAEVDFDLGLSKSAGGNTVAAKDFKMDFDLSGSQSAVSEKAASMAEDFSKTTILSKSKPSAEVDATSILSRADVQAAEAASPMDFDISGILPGDVKKVAESTTMDFDLSGSNMELPKEGNKPAQSASMDFDLSGDVPSPAFRQTATDMESTVTAMNFNDLVFEIPTSEAKPVEEKPKAAADDGMAFSIDFPTADVGATSTKPAAANTLDIDFGNININFEEDAPVHAGGEGKDEQWHEVATKLDLAKAYQEMGDADGAREILEEVMRDGDPAQRESAEKLKQQIAA